MWKRERSKSVTDIRKKLEQEEDKKRKKEEEAKNEKIKEAQAAFLAWLVLRIDKLQVTFRLCSEEYDMVFYNINSTISDCSLKSQRRLHRYLGFFGVFSRI